MKLTELRLSSSLHGWDPLRIVAQILTLQAVHYILLAAFVPPLLAIFTEPSALKFEGGPVQVGMLIDWRELAGMPTWDWAPLQQFVNTYTTWGPQHGAGAANFTPAERQAVEKWTAGSLWLDNPQAPAVVPPSNFYWEGRPESAPATSSLAAAAPTQNATTNTTEETRLEQWEWRLTHDSSRGWAIASAWAITIPFDVHVLYYLVRKPTHMLDFVCTMHILHFVVTAYYASALPVSLFWWIVMFVHGSICVVLSERFAIQREMRVGFADHVGLEEAGPEAIEMNRPRQAM